MRIDALVTANEQLQKSMKSTESKNSDKLDAAITRNKWLDGQLLNAQKSIMEVASKTKTMREAYSSEADEAKALEVRLTKEVMTLRTKVESLEIQLKHKQKEVEDLEEDLELNREEAQKVVSELRAEVQNLQAEKVALAEDREALQTDQMSLKSQVLQQDDCVKQLRRERDEFINRDSELKKDLNSWWL